MVRWAWNVRASMAGMMQMIQRSYYVSLLMLLSNIETTRALQVQLGAPCNVCVEPNGRFVSQSMSWAT